jgi:competence protein ComEC
LYVAVVGFIVSLYRALVMAVVIIVASVFRRPIDPVKALAHAFVIVLLVLPHTFFSVAFQLSFMATFAVLLSVRTLRPPATKTFATRLAFSIRSSLVVSLAAQLFVIPLILDYFGRVSLLSPVATLVFVLPVAFVLISSGVAVLVSIAVPLAGSFLFVGLDRVATLFQASLVASAAMVPGTVSFVAPDVWLYYGGLGLFVFARGRLWPKVGGTVVIVLSFAVALLRG